MPDPGVAVGDGVGAAVCSAIGDGEALAAWADTGDGEATAAGVAVGDGVGVGVGGTVTEGSAGGSTAEIDVDVAARSDSVNGVDVAAGRTLSSPSAIGVVPRAAVAPAADESVGVGARDSAGTVDGASASAETAASVAVGAGPGRLPGPQQTATAIRLPAARAMATRAAVLVLMPALRMLRRCRRSWASRS